MLTIDVFHFAFGDRGQKVASVTVAEGAEETMLETAYRLTNSIQSGWWLNQGVTPTEAAKNGCRSTSMGDELELNGKRYVVATFGFLPAEQADKDPLIAIHRRPHG